MLYVARHGRTTRNEAHRICGRADAPLTATGIAQAERLGRRLQSAGVSPDRIIASPLERARETARIAAETAGFAAPIETDERLVEVDFGDYDGLAIDDGRFLAVKRNPAVRAPNGESMIDAACRVYAALDELNPQIGDRSILVVCHGAVCRLVHTYFHSLTVEEFPAWSVDNADFNAYGPRPV